MENTSPPIFVSYAKLDVTRAREVYQWLTRGGLDCWMDEVSLRVGQDWKREIDKAIRTSQIFVACLSTNAVNHRGFFQTELRKAYEVWKTVPPQQVFLLPVRLDECEIPEEIESLHYLDFFAPEGPTKLLRDISHYVAPDSPALRLSEALEHIRLRRLNEALKTLGQLKIIVDDRNPELRVRILFDIACAHSLLAETTVHQSPERSSALETALDGLKEWYEYGLTSAWFRIPWKHAGLGVATVSVCLVAMRGISYVPIQDFALIANFRFASMILVLVGTFLQARWIREKTYLGTWNADVLSVVGVILVILIFDIITVETKDVFQVAKYVCEHNGPGEGSSEWARLTNLQQLSLSGVWLVYSIGLMVVGIWRRQRGVRISSFALFGFTILKIFIYDLSFLDTLYRIFSFIGLGVILLAVSYVYQRYKVIIFGEKEPEMIDGNVRPG